MTASAVHGLPAGFEFVRLLGRGATGTVLLARQTSLSRLVAVKVIQTVAARSAIERLRREARVLAGLNHRHILPVYQLQEAPASLALIMKFEPWGDLGTAMPFLSGSQRVTVLRDVASALDAAHRQGVVHRDLKPANILSDEYGRAVLADFGLARLPRHTDAFRTVGLTVTGTPLYLAPEQIREPQLEAPAIDHYAYGILAYQLLTGRWPYADPTWSSVTQLHLEAEPVRPGDARPGLDPTVGATLLGLLRKDPRQRQQPLDLVGAAADVAPAEWDALIPGGVPPPQVSAAFETETAVTLGGVTTAFGWSSSVGETAAPEVRPPALGHPDPIDLPGPQPWIEPPVYRPKRKRRLAVRLTVLVGGIVVGVTAYLFWLYR